MKNPLCSDCKNSCMVEWKIKTEKINGGMKCYDYCKKRDKIVNIGNYYEKCDFYEEQDGLTEEIEITKEKVIELMNNSEENARPFRIY